MRINCKISARCGPGFFPGASITASPARWVVPLVLRAAFYFIPSAMTGSIVSVFSFLNRVSGKAAFEGLELGEGKLSRPVLRGPGGRKPAWLLGSYRRTTRLSPDLSRNRKLEIHTHDYRVNPLRPYFTLEASAGLITSKTHLQEPSVCFFQIVTPLPSSVRGLPSGPFTDIRLVPVEYAKSPDCETSTFSVFQVIENPGVANDSVTYLRIASFPTIGRAPGASIVASSAQNGSTRFRSCEAAAASQSASVLRIAASSSERFTLCDPPHPPATAIASAMVVNSLNLVTFELLRNGAIVGSFVACYQRELASNLSRIFPTAWLAVC